MAEEATQNISAVVVTYHTGAVLWACLSSLSHHKNLCDIIVVNNGNPADVEEELAAWCEKHPLATLITGGGNVGFAAASNLGVEQAKGKYIAIVNPDAIMLEDDGLSRLAELTERQPDRPALVGGRLVDLDGSEQRGSRRNLLTPLTAISENFGLWHLDEYTFPRFNLHQEPLPDEPVVVPAISGACMVMRKKDYDTIGGLDDGYFLHVEDVDLCRRVLQAGGNVWFHPHVRVIHHLSTSNVSSLFVEWQKTKSFLRYFWRYGASSGRFLQLLILFLAIFRFIVRVIISTLRSVWQWSFNRVRAYMNREEKDAG